MKYFLLIAIGIILSVSNSSSEESKKLPYCSDKSIWKHAAYRGESNSHITNIETAIDQGYCGIELDVIYDEDEEIIYIAYDPIDSVDEKNYYSLDRIDKVLKDSKVYIWLDWKNSKLFNLANGSDFIQKSMKSYLSKEGSIIFIETPNVFHNEILNILNRDNRNISILNWLSFNQETNNFKVKIKNIFRFFRAWLYVCVLPDRWISTPNIELLNLCKDKQKVNSIFVFTINELEKAKTIFLMGADVILSDQLQN